MARWFNRGLLFALALSPLAITAARAQLNWRYFNIESDGLEARYATYLSFSPKGKLWIRYQDNSSITELTGYEGRTIPGPTGSVVGFRIYESVTGQLWTQHPQGVLLREGDNWRLFEVRAIEDEIKTQFTRFARPIPLLPAEYNGLLILLSDRLLKFDALTQQTNLIKQSASVGLVRMSDLVPALEGGLWITAENGIARLPAPKGRLDKVTPGSPWEVHLIPDSLDARNPQRPFEDGGGGLLMVAEDRTGANRIWLHFRDGQWTIEPLPRGTKSAWMTDDGKAWGLEPSHLFQWSPPNLATRDMDDIGVRPWGNSDIAMEPSGAFWVSTEDGVWRYAPFSWRPPRGAPELNEAITDIHETSDGTLWFLGAGHLFRLRSGQWDEFAKPGQPERAEVTATKIGEFADGRIFFTDGGGLVSFDPGDKSPVGGRFERLASPGGGPLRYLGSSTNAHWFVQTSADGTVQQLATCDGSTFAGPGIAQPADTIGGWTTILETDGGDLWLGGSGGAARFTNGSWTNYTVADGLISQGVNSFLDRGKGTVWAATHGGLLVFGGQSWAEMQTGLDQVNQMATSDDGTVWLATEGGLLRQYETEWIALGAEEGVPAGIHVFHQSGDGRLWFGHARGLSVFHPEVDREGPQTYLDKPGETIFSGTEIISFDFKGRDRWKATSPDRLLYYYRIDDGTWRPSAATRVDVPVNNLLPGQHRFEVYAMDRLLNKDISPAAWAFTVIVPWYKEPRMVGIVLLAALSVLVFAGLAVNRHLRLVRSYAEIERIVDERTHQLEIANRELLHAEKMRSLGTLAAGVAHDFNSILSIIRGSVQIIEAHPENEEKLRTRISRIKSMVDQGSTLVKAMLGFSQADDVRLVLDDVGAVVEDTARLLGDRLPPEVEVTVDVTPGLPPVRGTKELVQQIILNLMLNALDAMERHGRLGLRCQRAHHIPEHWVIVPAHAEEYVAVSVEDTGSGISPENLSRIFEPFFTTKAFSTRHGTGLGLSMVYEFCKELGYGINVRSELKKGTAFTIVIPVLPQSAAAPPGIHRPRVDSAPEAF